MNNNSSTEAAKFAYDLLFCYGGESACENPIRPKTTEILRSNLVVSQNVYQKLANNIDEQQNRVFFVYAHINTTYFNRYQENSCLFEILASSVQETPCNN